MSHGGEAPTSSNVGSAGTTRPPRCAFRRLPCPARRFRVPARRFVRPSGEVEGAARLDRVGAPPAPLALPDHPRCDHPRCDDSRPLPSRLSFSLFRPDPLCVRLASLDAVIPECVCDATVVAGAHERELIASIGTIHSEHVLEYARGDTLAGRRRARRSRRLEDGEATGKFTVFCVDVGGGESHCRRSERPSSVPASTG